MSLHQVVGFFIAVLGVCILLCTVLIAVIRHGTENSANSSNEQARSDRRYRFAMIVLGFVSAFFIGMALQSWQTN